ncbi:mpv17-like protein [Erpetoichthys calabaricus]|uniref:Si:ch211-120k19.1 n=1 Tax=Erpetoichthys calabaricus TaxID=27687 RepID=A0A8C4STP4_ERPCA|nr:mpv17-like protein [Erpetoichthys calabaricus]
MHKVRSLFQAYPWGTNVAAYTALFAGADLLQQSMLGEDQKMQNSERVLEEPGVMTERMRPASELLDGRKKVDLYQTAKVSLIGLCFHSNFNFFWLNFLERVFPGVRPLSIGKKVISDQLVAAPITIAAFYTGLSILDRKDDVFQDLHDKFWPSYQTGIIYWSSMQVVNFSIVPPFMRTAFIGACAFIWTSFLCYFRCHDTEQVLRAFKESIPIYLSPSRPENAKLEK